MSSRIQEAIINFLSTSEKAQSLLIENLIETENDSALTEFLVKNPNAMSSFHQLRHRAVSLSCKEKNLQLLDESIKRFGSNAYDYKRAAVRLVSEDWEDGLKQLIMNVISHKLFAVLTYIQETFSENSKWHQMINAAKLLSKRESLSNDEFLSFVGNEAILAVLRDAPETSIEELRLLNTSSRSISKKRL